MRRHHRSATALLLVLAACSDDGGDEPRTVASSTTSSSPSSTSSTTPAADATFEVALTAEGEFEKGAVHVLRVEDAEGKRMFEHTVAAPASKAEELAPGSYRLLAFYRECRKDGCGPDSPLADFAEPDGICGSQFTIEADKKTRATVKAVAGEACTIALL